MQEQLKPLELQLVRVKDLPAPEFVTLQAWEARAHAAAQASGESNANDSSKNSQGQGYSGTPMPYLGETRVCFCTVRDFLHRKFLIHQNCAY